MAKPRVSILMTTWNRASLVVEAIRSAQSQTFVDWELVIVDDGSTDSTEETVKALAKEDGRIKYIRLEHLGRIAIVSNIGIRAARGEYVAILDDDDKWADAKKLEKQVRFLDEHKDYVGCGGGFIVMDEKGNENARVLKPEKNSKIRNKAILANPMANSTAMFRRSIAEKVGFYDESLKQFADWDFWLKIGMQGKLYNFPEYLAYYRMWDRGMSFAKQKDCAASAIRIVRRHKDNYPNFFFAAALAYLYRIYTFVPMKIRVFFNPILSKLKKAIFSGDA